MNKDISWNEVNFKLYAEDEDHWDIGISADIKVEWTFHGNKTPGEWSDDDIVIFAAYKDGVYSPHLLNEVRNNGWLKESIQLWIDDQEFGLDI